MSPGPALGEVKGCRRPSPPAESRGRIRGLGVWGASTGCSNVHNIRTVGLSTPYMRSLGLREGDGRPGQPGGVTKPGGVGLSCLFPTRDPQAQLSAARITLHSLHAISPEPTLPDHTRRDPGGFPEGSLGAWTVSGKVIKGKPNRRKAGPSEQMPSSRRSR